MEKELWQDGTGSYLKIRGEGEETFADRMFTYQDIPGFLPMQITWVNGQKEYAYDISGKLSLAAYLEEQEVGKEQIKDILKQVLGLSERIRGYLLEGNGVVCHKDYIYIDKRSGQVYGIYQENSPYGGVPAVGTLLEDIMDRMDGKDETLSFFIYGLHKLTKETGMTPHLLSEYIEMDEEKQESGTPAAAHRKPDGQKRKETVPERPERQQDKTAYVLPLILLAAGCLLTFAIWYGGWFTKPLSRETDLAAGIGAGVFFMGVAGYGAWRLWPEKRTAGILWEDTERPKKVCLVSCRGKTESIPIPYYPFVLGAEETRVDGVIRASGIDGIHAQIRCEGDELYVMDEESERGTYHNEERLAPWHKKRLQDGDILRLAETEYVVEIS